MNLKHLVIVSVVVFLDQITKTLAKSGLESGSIQILPFLFLTYRENTGAGFSLLQGHNMLIAFATIIIICLMIYYFRKFDSKERIFAALVIGGAIGNLIDRIILRFVVDFIDLTFWPTFNIADAAISVGAIGLIYLSFRKS